MQFHQAKEFIFTKLKDELPAHLSYHSIDHTIDVYAAAKKIGEAEEISEHDMQLLLTAALFHDTGFIVKAKDHEDESCKIAEQYLPQFGYSAQDIEKVKGMILATRLPQSPKNHLEEIIADADLDYLGRDDFFENGNNLYLEFMHAGIVKNETEWNTLQVKFLEAHHYFTQTSLRSRQAKKAEHLLLVKAKLA